MLKAITENYIMVRSIHLFSLLVLGIFTTSAWAVSEAAKIGANAGAMEYCRDNIASSDDRGKYNVVSLQALGEFNDLDSDDKLKALILKKAAGDGDYLGDPLDEDRCDGIRKLLFLRYAGN